MKKKRSLRQIKKWIALALVALMITPIGSIWAAPTILKGNEETIKQQDESELSSDIKDDMSTETVDKKKEIPAKTEDTASILKPEGEIPTVFADIEPPKLKEIVLEQNNTPFLYDMEKLRTEVVLFETSVHTVFEDSNDSGMLPAGSIIELTTSSPISDLSFTGFIKTESDPDATVEIYADGADKPFYSEPITGDYTAVKLPEGGAHKYKFVFPKITVPKNDEMKISTHINVDVNRPLVDKVTLEVKADIPEEGTFISNKDTNEFYDVEEPLNYETVEGNIAPSNDNIMSLEELKSNPNVEYTVKCGFNYSDRFNDSPMFLRLKDTVFQSHTDEDMILKKLVIPKGFSGLDDEIFQGAKTFDLYINDKLFKKDLSISEDHTITFTDEIHREFKIVPHNRTVQRAVKESYYRKSLLATYECKINDKKGAYPIYIEGATMAGTKIISSLEPNPSAIKDNPSDTYFLQTPFLNNEAEKKSYSIGEDIVFNIDNLHASKYNGDYSFNYLTLDTSTDLKEYYYLKQVDLVPITRPSKVEVPESIKLNLVNDEGQELANGGKVNDELYTFTNDDATINASQLTGICLKPNRKRIDRDILQGDAYSIFTAVSGLDLRNFTVKLTYAPRPNKTITEDKVFTNNVQVAMSPSNNLYDIECKRNLISGTTKIQITPDTEDPDTEDPDTEDPDTGNPDAGKPDTGNPDTGNPDTGNPDAGNPDTGNPDAEKPDAGKPDTGNPDTGKPDAEKPETGNPDSGNQQTPDVDSALKDSHDSTVKNTPVTGDNTNAGLWFGLLLATGTGSVVLLRHKYKGKV